MNIHDLRNAEPATLADTVFEAELIMQGFAHTLLVIAGAMRANGVDGHAMVRDAAVGIVEIQRENIDKARDEDEAELRRRAVEQFKRMIGELFPPTSPPKQ